MNRTLPEQQKRMQTTIAARSNLVPLTAWGYELWRKKALTLLSGRDFPLGEEYHLLLNSVQHVAGLQFIDLGTSTGLYSRALLLSGAQKVYALDFSPAMLKVAVQKVERGELPVGWSDIKEGGGRREEGSNGDGKGGLILPLATRNPPPAVVKELYQGFVPMLARAEAIPLPDASLDGAVVGGSWNEFPQPERVVQEMYRVLKPGGRIWIMFSHRSTGPLQRVLEWSGLRFPTLEELRGLLEDTGFQTLGWREGSVGFVSGTKIR